MKTKLFIVVKRTGLFMLAVFAIIWKLHANKATEKQNIEFANLKAQSLPVVVDTVAFIDYNDAIEISGEIKNKMDLLLFAETQGRIVKLFKKEGDWVKKGDVLLQVDDEVLKEQLILAKTNFDLSKRNLSRMKKLAENEAVTQKTLEDIELKYSQSKADLVSIKKQLENTKITSPVSGYINEGYVEIGMLISGNSRLYNIISTEELLVNAQVNGMELSRLKIGDNVEITSDNFHGKVFSGKITNIAKKASTNNRFSIEVSINNQPDLKAGMYIKGSIDKQQINKILIKRSAIIGTVKDASVFVVKNEILEEQKIQINKIIGDLVEIKSGLKPNDLIVSSGTINLYENARIHIIK